MGQHFIEVFGKALYPPLNNHYVDKWWRAGVLMTKTGLTVGIFFPSKPEIQKENNNGKYK